MNAVIDTQPNGVNLFPAADNALTAYLDQIERASQKSDAFLAEVLRQREARKDGRAVVIYEI